MNFWGKTLLELKRVGSVISASASDIGSTVAGAAANIADHTKKSAKYAMLEAEMTLLYKELGSVVFEGGLTPDNECAMNLMNQLYEKSAEMDKLREEMGIEDPFDNWDDFDDCCDLDCDNCNDSECSYRVTDEDEDDWDGEDDDLDLFGGCGDCDDEFCGSHPKRQEKSCGCEDCNTIHINKHHHR